MTRKHPRISDILEREQMVESQINRALLDREYWLNEREREQKCMFARRDAKLKILEAGAMEVEKMEAEIMAAKLKIQKAEPMEGKAVGMKSMEIEVGGVLNEYKPNAEFARNEEILKIVEETTDYKTALAKFYISLDDYKKDIWEYNKEVSSFNEERRECQSICDMVARLPGKILEHNKRANNLANWAKLLKIAEEDLERKARKRIHFLILASAS